MLALEILFDKVHTGFRRWILERKLASSRVPQEEQINLIKDLERKETEYMRLKRHKICVDDFELLTIIGRGAFGEVCGYMIHLYGLAFCGFFFLLLLDSSDSYWFV